MVQAARSQARLQPESCIDHMAPDFCYLAVQVLFQYQARRTPITFQKLTSAAEILTDDLMAHDPHPTVV